MSPRTAVCARWVRARVSLAPALRHRVRAHRSRWSAHAGCLGNRVRDIACGRHCHTHPAAVRGEDASPRWAGVRTRGGWAVPPPPARSSLRAAVCARRRARAGFTARAYGHRVELRRSRRGARGLLRQPRVPTQSPRRSAAGERACPRGRSSEGGCAAWRRVPPQQAVPPPLGGGQSGTCFRRKFHVSVAGVSGGARCSRLRHLPHDRGAGSVGVPRFRVSGDGSRGGCRPSFVDRFGWLRVLARAARRRLLRLTLLRCGPRRWCARTCCESLSPGFTRAGGSRACFACAAARSHDAAAAWCGLTAERSMLRALSSLLSPSFPFPQRAPYFVKLPGSFG